MSKNTHCDSLLIDGRSSNEIQACAAVAAAT